MCLHKSGFMALLSCTYKMITNFRRNTYHERKVVLAYSGGLDTTTLIPWLKETFDYEVICCCIDCGQGNELDGLEERAKLSVLLNYILKISLMNSVTISSCLA